MRKALWVMLLLAIPVLAGCSFPETPAQPPPGFIFTHYKAPLKIDFDDTKLGTKTGKASTQYFNIPIFGSWSLAWNEADIASALQKAQAAGGITEVTHADYEFFNVLTVYGKFTVIAHGE